MGNPINANKQWLSQLLAQSNYELRGKLGDREYEARIIIPHYRAKLVQHYSDIIQGNLASECQQAELELPFEHFGVVIRFEQAQEVRLYQDNAIEPGLCEIIRETGIVVLQNVYHEQAVRNEGHRNRFPHLQFHIDRGRHQEARYSLYTRDPFDPEQRMPRTASTLFIPNITGHLQGIKEGSIQRGIDTGQITSSQLFATEVTANLIGNIILEQAWNQAEGVGEIAMIDNASVLHASYYRDAERSGYRIGVRYLSGFPV